MKYYCNNVTAALFLILISGCVSADQNRSEVIRRTDRNLISSQLIAEYGFMNAYDAVQRINSRWLQTRGIDSFNSPTQVWVYLDNSRFGNVETLRTIYSTDIEYIRYFPPDEATARWGLDHGQGVIFVSTRRQ